MRIDTALAANREVDQREAARAAELEGFDGLWVGEVTHDPFVMHALAATVTERIELGTSIALALARNPMSLAVTANDLQAITKGRLVLGLGSQVKAHITRRFDMPWSRPAARMREFVLAMQAIWACWEEGEGGAKLDFEGEFYTHTLMPPMFVPRPHDFGPPKVLLAAVGSAMTEAAGEVADGFICHGFTTPRYLSEVTLPALRRGRGGALDEFEVVGNPMIVTGRTEAEFASADRETRAQIAFYGSTPAYRPVLELHGWGELGDELHELSRQQRWGEMSGLVDDTVLAEFAVVGEPDAVGAELSRRYETLLTRCVLHAAYDIEDGTFAEVARGARSEGATDGMPA